MPVDPLLAATAMRSGLSAVCSTCRRYWEGREKGLPEPQCTAVTRCGSPLAGDDFHEYSGPLSDFSKFCFVCAAPSDYGVSVRRAKARMIGVCRKHIRLLAELTPLGADAVVSTVKTPEGHAVTPEELLPKSKPSLFETIAAVEKTFESETE